MILLTLFLGCAQETWPDEGEPRCEADAFSTEPKVARVRAGGMWRSALVFTPPGAGPHDVVVNLHEWRSEPLRQAHYSGWMANLEASNAILVMPDGKSAMWNAGKCCGKARDEGIDDVTFLNELVKSIDKTGCTTGRVLATGIGNGGMMAERWACESDVVDAVVSVGGSLQVESCSVQKPIPVLHYHGVDDKFIPADGSGNHYPVLNAQKLWNNRNGAGAMVELSDGQLNCRTFQGKAPVVFCDVTGMGDQWPGAERALVESTLELRSASTGAWKWVQQNWQP